MIEIDRLTAFGKPQCRFADRCDNNLGPCNQIRITASPELYDSAVTHGLKAELVDEGEHTGTYFTGRQITRIILCQAARKQEPVIVGLRQFMVEAGAPADTYVEPQELRALKEIAGVIERTMEIDDILTEEGLSALDRVTGGEEVRDYPVRNRLSDLGNLLELVPIYLQEQNAPNVL